MLIPHKTCKELLFKLSHINIKLKLKVQLLDYSSQGIIEKVEYAERASPVVPVRKPSGEIRLCGDNSGAINKCMISDVYPLPT